VPLLLFAATRPLSFSMIMRLNAPPFTPTTNFGSLMNAGPSEV